MPAIIDTDPGIDDAIAILHALRVPDLDILALTTVAGNIGLSVTTGNAGRIVACAGVPTPVHAGAAAPLGREPRPETGVHGTDGLGGVTFPAPLAEPASRDAVAYMAEALMAAEPKTIDLLCLAPLTNVALLLRHHPEAAARIRRIIAMGGAVDEPGNMGADKRAEFNLAHDPEAAAEVLHAGLDLVLIPLDATRQFRANADFIARLRTVGTAPSVACADLIEAYFAQTEGQTQIRESRPLHDPCVPLYALRPDLFRLETRSLQVEPESGALVPGPYQMQVAMGVDADGLRDALAEGLAC
ncbi:nucleoside hydrolase [Maritimibacter alkaliphilus]|uniref:nucleoside hydrolase n=1 Tax=Maritimibacter alkaliphilus TaxID=404236 RepID=UPI001C98419C|nr:nucleoside hydrolase [Maritimibacter alkaliphilus]MBY6091604.1 nucleoside hydrolase [Maritimibacter alkaliphilus]